MDAALIKLSIERLLEKVEQLEHQNKVLIERVEVLEQNRIQFSTKTEQKTENLDSTLLDTKEVLKILGISYNTLQAIVKKKILVPIRINKRRIRFTKKAISDYIKMLSNTT